MEKMRGIDVSHWQGKIDWSAVAKSEIEFVMIKAGGSDDGLYTDSMFENNYAGAKSNGVYVGAYYFVGPDFTSKEAGIEDAKRFLQIIKNKTFEMPVMLDLESTRIEDKIGATDAAIAFCETIENAGYYVGIYGSDIYGFKERMEIDRLTAYDKWVARYGGEPRYVCEYGIWQYTSMGSVSGINCNVDMNIAYKDYPSIIKAAKLNRFVENAETIPEETPEEMPVTPVEPETANPDGSILDLAVEVMKGNYGDGDVRKDRLGNRYDEVQSFINHIYEESAETLAEEVKEGKYGNGDTRKIVLGDRYDEVQTIVNNNSQVYYTVQPGDTLSKIAAKYETTYQKIAKINGIKNPNLIYPGQTLKIK